MVWLIMSLLLVWRVGLRWITCWSRILILLGSWTILGQLVLLRIATLIARIVSRCALKSLLHMPPLALEMGAGIVASLLESSRIVELLLLALLIMLVCSLDSATAASILLLIVLLFDRRRNNTRVLIKVLVIAAIILVLTLIILIRPILLVSIAVVIVVVSCVVIFVAELVP